MSEYRRIRRLIARYCCLIGGPVMFVIGIVELVRKQPDALEMILAGCGIFVVGVVWTLIVKWLKAAGGDGAKPDEKVAESVKSEESADDFIEKIPAMAEMHIKKMHELSGRLLEYNEACFEETDKMIEEGWGGECPVMLDTVVLTFGSFVGEAIRRIHGGQWVYDEKHGGHLINVGGKGSNIKIFPFSKIKKRFQNSDEDSIGYYYTVIKQMINERFKG
ncbi:MAG: hypothetical protein K9M75_01710 [Phycisphaerae bacterium]|nr:hypothetical protein [Phycisphaerae bacterium]